MLIKRACGLRSKSTERVGSEHGFTLLEMLVSLTLSLVVLIAVYTLIDSCKRRYLIENDLTTAQASGRAAIDLIGYTARTAGYSPLGLPFDAIPSGDTVQVQFLADLDGDASVGVAGEVDENYTYLFSGPAADGTYTLVRGTDLNSDGDFLDTDESVQTIATDIVPIDTDGDGTDEPFFAYDLAPPDTAQLTISFGARTKRINLVSGAYTIVPFTSNIALRNNL